MQCTALACPRIAYWFGEHPDTSNRAMYVDFHSSLATKDVLGHTWCNYCQKHRDLMNWGHAHAWPEIHVTGEQGRYAIAQGQWHWVTSIIMGHQDAIDAYYASVIGGQQEIA